MENFFKMLALGGGSGGGAVTEPIDPKYLPEGVPYSVAVGKTEILPEYQPPFDAEEGYYVIADFPALSVGETYTIAWNGVEYPCVAQDGATFGDPSIVVLGNVSILAGGMNTGEPFVFIVQSRMAMVAPSDGTTDATIAVYVVKKDVRKLPEDLLPDAAKPYYVQFEHTPHSQKDVYNLTVTETVDNLMEQYSNGRHIVGRISLVASGAMAFAQLAMMGLGGNVVNFLAPASSGSGFEIIELTSDENGAYSVSAKKYA